MKEKFLIILLILNLGMMVAFNQKLKDLEIQVNKISLKKMSKAEAEIKTKIIAKEMKSKAKSVLSLRCQDSSKAPPGISSDKPTYPKKWHGTASKIGQNLIITADHLISNNGDDKTRVFPIECKFFQKGLEVASFNSKNQSYKQVGTKDIVILQVKFNKDGKKIEPLIPEVYSELSVGENLILITHPKQMINDYLITFGMVLNDDTTKVLASVRKDYWKNSIITDMTAAPGSSGSPLFTIDGKFIGLHVGGDRDGIQANYQMVFDADFYFNYQMVRLLNWAKEETP